jgi:RNAse (barnase) inhibitor barstar
MASRSVYELPGEQIRSLEDFWTVIGEVINGPGGYFGRNLDAFRDCLSGGFGTPAHGKYTIRWAHSEFSRAALGYPETIRQLTERLESCHASYRRSVGGQLWDAEHGRGPTVFDWLVTIIREEPSVELELR